MSTRLFFFPLGLPSHLLCEGIECVGTLLLFLVLLLGPKTAAFLEY